ncbi:MAG: hypothetical protein JST87_00970 [Bacteroidetes bacterium]|nr:hypothetical protein [Bacteroidota bacterium]
MELIEINKQNQPDFIRVNVELNQNDANYIRPLDKDVNEVFDPKKNKAFRFGECIRWVLKDKDGKLIGRIAAFVNKKYKSKGDDVPVGGVGFFDCINNQEAADMLFDVAKHWLMQKGMQAMDGPINFGERDRWWGLVVQGFEPPLYCMNYNPPYYKDLFETYGFKNFFNQICFGLTVANQVQQKFFDRHAACAADPNFSATFLKKNQLDKFARDFTIVYNKAFAGHGGMKEMAEANVRKLFHSLKPIIDENVSWFVYYKNEPVAMWMNIPDLNQWFKYLHGKFGLLQKLKFLWVKKTKKCDKFVGLAFGVIPEWQAKGVDSYMIVEGAKIIQKELKYTKYEMQWIGEFNPKMINIAENLGTHRSRILTTYRYLFDRTKEFKRHPIL